MASQRSFLSSRPCGGTPSFLKILNCGLCRNRTYHERDVNASFCQWINSPLFDIIQIMHLLFLPFRLLLMVLSHIVRMSIHVLRLIMVAISKTLLFIVGLWDDIPLFILGSFRKLFRRNPWARCSFFCERFRKNSNVFQKSKVGAASAAVHSPRHLRSAFGLVNILKSRLELAKSERFRRKEKRKNFKEQFLKTLKAQPVGYR